MQNILRQTVTNALLAYGMAFVIISGSIDLSVAATVAMSGYITVCSHAALFLCAGIGRSCLFVVAVGTINGYLIAKVKFPPMITYSMQLMIKRLSVLTNITLKISTDSLIMKYLGHGMLFNLLPLGFVFNGHIWNMLSIRRIPIIRAFTRWAVMRMQPG